MSTYNVNIHEDFENSNNNNKTLNCIPNELKIYYLKSEQDHHDQLPGLFPPRPKKTGVASTGWNWGGWVVFYDSTLSILNFCSTNYLKLKPRGVGGFLQSEEGGVGGGIAATLASRSTKVGT